MSEGPTGIEARFARPKSPKDRAIFEGLLTRVRRDDGRITSPRSGAAIDAETASRVASGGLTRSPNRTLRRVPAGIVREPIARAG